MSDLISRKDAIELLKNDIENNGLPLYDDYNIGINHAMCLLACVPIAEPKVGRWIHNIHYGLNLPEHRCSICGEWEYSDTESNYCPNCGAKMEGASDEHTDKGH